MTLFDVDLAALSATLDLPGWPEGTLVAVTRDPVAFRLRVWARAPDGTTGSGSISDLHEARWPNLPKYEPEPPKPKSRLHRLLGVR